MERRVHASSESDVFAGKDGGVRHPHDSRSISPGRWADMNIASPHLVHLHAPFGWPPRHLGGMTDGLATRWCSRSRTQIIGSEPRVQLAITPDRRVDPWVSRPPFCPLASPASPINDHRAGRHAV